jgi:hypothetical protein
MDFKRLKAEEEAAAADAAARGVPASKVHETVALYDQYSALITEAETARSERNRFSKEMGYVAAPPLSRLVCPHTQLGALEDGVGSHVLQERTCVLFRDRTAPAAIAL